MRSIFLRSQCELSARPEAEPPWRTLFSSSLLPLRRLCRGKFSLP